MAQAKTDAPRKDHVGEYHRQFADAIIRQIEAGTAPWQKPCPPCRKSRSRQGRSCIVRM